MTKLIKWLFRWAPKKRKPERTIPARIKTKYDDSSWHTEGDFPADLPPEAGGYHIGFFLSWAALRGLCSDLVQTDRLIDRTITPGRFAMGLSGQSWLSIYEFNDEGRVFLDHYYMPLPVPGKPDPSYISDLEEEFRVELAGRVGYYIEDTWENFDRLTHRLDRQLSSFRQVRDAKAAEVAKSDDVTDKRQA